MNEDSTVQAYLVEPNRLREAFPVPGMYQISAEGKLLAANSALAHMVGCDSVEELMSLDLEEELYAGLDTRRRNLRTLLEKDRPEKGCPMGVEFQLFRRDGTILFVEEHARAVTAADGTVLYDERTLTDVTERRRAQDKLRESEAQYRVIAETASDCIVTISAPSDGESRILFVNHAVESMFGYTPAEITGQPLVLLMPEALRQAHREAFGRYLATGVKQVNWRATLTRGLHKDGHEFPLEISFGEHLHAGVRAFTGILRDVSERQQDRENLAAYAQQLKERNRELKAALAAAEEAGRLKAQFLMNVSHEIRTPMNAILGMSALLMETPLTTEQTEYAQAMNDAVAALLAVLSDILDVSRIEAGTLAIEAREFDIRTIIGTAMQLMSSTAREKDLTLTHAVAPDVPVVVRGDATRVRQVLINLLGNAVKFTQRGGVEVRVMRSGDSHPGTIPVRFEVHDTGIGIEAGAVSRIFEPFTQADGTLTRKYGGTGLGLTISKQLVEKMGGILTVESQPGVGSVFAFTIPFGTQAAA